MSWFWLLTFAWSGIMSVAILNPIPIGLAFVLWLISRPVEKNLTQTMAEGGITNPNLPPVPTNPTRGCSCLLWLLVMGLSVLILAAVVMTTLSGELNPSLVR